MAAGRNEFMYREIPFSAPDITQREISAVVEVLQTPVLTCGPRVEQFEEICARVAGRSHGIAVNSGTSALHCTMAALGIKEGDEVITTPFSFVASTNCILFMGAKPVFVDINPRTLNLDPAKVEAAITPQTRAIVAVEALGHPGDMAEIEQLALRHELALVEDSCEGFGGKCKERAIGSFGRASCFAFYPNKQITAGEGGMIVTDDDCFAELCRSLRNHGREGMAWLSHQRLGYSFRMSEINAALAVAQSERLEEILMNRRRAAKEYFERLIDNHYVLLPTIAQDISMSWFVFVVQLNDLFEPGDRDELIKTLRSEGIGCSNYFPPIHLQPYIMETMHTRRGDYPVCEYISDRTVALPFFNQITSEQIDRVCSVLNEAAEKILLGRKDRFETI